MRIPVGLFCATLLSGCASYFTVRPPIMEDKLGISGSEKVGTLSTAADYRVVYVRLDKEVKLCAEPPADAAAQFGQTFTAAFQGPLGGAKEMGAEAKAGLAVAMKQLFKRSQGVQLYRDGGFLLCNLYLNEGISKSEYIVELRALRETASRLIEKEIPTLNTVIIDPIVVPVTPAPPASTLGTTGGTKPPDTGTTPAPASGTAAAPTGK
jgi:hypothetical protein